MSYPQGAFRPDLFSLSPNKAGRPWCEEEDVGPTPRMTGTSQACPLSCQGKPENRSKVRDHRMLLQSHSESHTFLQS